MIHSILIHDLDFFQINLTIKAQIIDKVTL